MAHYIAILKKHEETRASTNDRKKYWKDYYETAERNTRCRTSKTYTKITSKG